MAKNVEKFKVFLSLSSFIIQEVSFQVFGPSLIFFYSLYILDPNGLSEI